ncbi:L-iditol 2-dehydrogenase [Macroventuria anomochaeta]|uniref:L-iditol 2-dehydrogenase n=1 Tax=Macroventuria anomochaeta TaxID=301207 RepID=A0ACB6RUK5_9PLEO|nr:L-iditol 2-dehydrogenase [Macroventuria anomochaeta]KAF2624624.1 L-iditol 2-dehydrogenase [Macroventuria anomochaeta]
MKAAQYFGPHDIRVVDVPTPEPEEHEALVAIEWCGICGSDLHEYLHGPTSCPPPSRPHPATHSHIPVTMGHEFTGRIISAPASSNLSSGTPVITDPRIFCRSCSRCKYGHTHGCTTLGFKGLSGTGGGFSETIAVDARMCHALPEDVDLSLAALIEPLAVAWHAIATAGLQDWGGKSVLVVGGGPVGVTVCIVLRAFGCGNIIVSEPTTVRAAQNEKVADVVLNPLHDSIGERCRSLTGGEGVDVVFDCAGSQKGFEAGMDAVRYRGLYMNIAAWFGSPMQIPFFPFLLKEVTIKCCLAYNDEEFKDVVEAFVAGRFKGLETMITSKIHIDDIVEKGFDESVANRDQHVKILVTPHKVKA